MTYETGEWSTLLHAGFPSFLKAPIVQPKREMLLKSKAKAAVLGVPFDSTSIYRTGSSMGPRAIRLASEQCLGYHEEFDIELSKDFKLVDVGDVPVIPGNAEKSNRLTISYVAEILKAGCVPVTIGGEHSIPTIGPVMALSKHVKGKIGLIVFDSHYDTAEHFAGEKLSHTTPFVRAIDWAGVRPNNMVLIGIHGATNPRSEAEYVKKAGIKVFKALDAVEHGMKDVAREALEWATDGTEAVYMSVDIDCLDASYCPGTGTPEPEGLTSRELLQGVRTICKGPVGGLDVVEVAPQYDVSGITAKIAVRVILDALCSIAVSRKSL